MSRKDSRMNKELMNVFGTQKEAPAFDRITISLTSLWDKLVKLGAKIVTRARYVTFQTAEVAVPSQLFGEILRLIDGLRPRPAPA